MKTVAKPCPTRTQSDAMPREGRVRATGAPASVTGAGSMFLVHMKQTPPRNYRDAYPTPDESRR
ncbi:MAG TPA: hypothetical protein VM940_10560, partial [Chthoniobacterales bacterium]|nr:hypothetical protein [Chthoniobacterales bacterium]